MNDFVPIHLGQLEYQVANRLTQGGGLRNG